MDYTGLSWAVFCFCWAVLFWYWDLQGCNEMIERTLGVWKLHVTFDLKKKVSTELNTPGCKFTFLLLNICDLACDDVTCLTLHHWRLGWSLWTQPSRCTTWWKAWLLQTLHKHTHIRKNPETQKRVLRYESSTLILYKELSIFQHLSVLRDQL